MGCNYRKNESVEDADLMRDQLSEFFGLISSLCQKAFSLIRQVFPAPAAPKVTRMLIDRLLNDPAFGIHVKVNEVLQADSKVSLIKENKIGACCPFTKSFDSPRSFPSFLWTGYAVGI